MAARRGHKSAGRRNYWTPELEHLSRDVMRQAAGYAAMYEEMVSTAKSWSHILNFMAGGIGGIVGTEGLLTTISFQADPNPRAALWLGVVGAILGYMVTVLVVLQNVWKFDTIKSEGLVAQVNFASLRSEIKFQLTLHASRRQNALVFVPRITQDIETLKLSSPTIDDRVRRRYQKVRRPPLFAGDPEAVLSRALSESGLVPSAGSPSAGSPPIPSPSPPDTPSDVSPAESEEESPENMLERFTLRVVGGGPPPPSPAADSIP